LFWLLSSLLCIGAVLVIKHCWLEFVGKTAGNLWKSEAFTIKFLNHNGGMTMENSQ